MAIDITKNYDWNSTGEDHEEPAVKIFKKWGRVAWVSRRLPQGEVVGSKIWWHESLSWMLLGGRAVEWSGSGDDSKEENFFSLGPVVWGLRRNHSYMLRNINRRNVLRQSQVLVRRWNFQKRDWGYRRFFWLTTGHSGRVSGVEEGGNSTRQRNPWNNMGVTLWRKRVIREFWTFGSCINRKDDSASPHGR